MLRSPHPLLPALALLASCTTPSFDPGDVIAGSSSSSSTHDTAASTTSPVLDDAPDPPTTTDATTSSTTTTTTPDPGTTLANTTADTTDDTTGAPLGCGDGIVDPGESCDDGHGSNSNSGSCTLACQAAVCNDGLLWDGHEACDDGNNNHGKWNGCNPDCSLAEHCGDGEKNGPEECDYGDANGTDEHPLDAVACSQTCYHEALIVFLGSTPFSAVMNGAKGADKHCQQLAEAAGIYGGAPFMAWISDINSNPASRFKPAVPGLPYALLSGLRIAKDRAALLANGPEDGITMTETGETIYKAVVWTATNPDGTKLAGDMDCDHWTKNSPLWNASVGRSGLPKQDPAWQTWKASMHWTAFKTLSCDQKSRLYCVEQ